MLPPVRARVLPVSVKPDVAKVRLPALSASEITTSPPAAPVKQASLPAVYVVSVVPFHQLALAAAQVPPPPKLPPPVGSQV
jgi:hypothetical protein